MEGQINIAKGALECKMINREVLFHVTMNTWIVYSIKDLLQLTTINFVHFQCHASVSSTHQYTVHILFFFYAVVLNLAKSLSHFKAYLVLRKFHGIELQMCKFTIHKQTSNDNDSNNIMLRTNGTDIS